MANNCNCLGKMKNLHELHDEILIDFKILIFWVVGSLKTTNVKIN